MDARDGTLFQSLKEKPRRNIVFLSPTCEETGFLGTKYYVEHPLFPIDKIAAVSIWMSSRYGARTTMSRSPDTATPSWMIP